jgi:protease I
MNKKAIILTWDGFSDEELIYAYYRLQEEKFDIVVASNKGKDNLGQKSLKGVNGVSFHSDLHVNLITNNDVQLYDLVILIGGVKAIEKLRQEKNVIDFISNFNKSGKIIGSVCHGMQLLISAKAIKNRNVSGYYSIKDDIENAGAVFIDEPAVVDGNIVSTAHYKDQGLWLRRVLDEFRKRE